MRALVGLIWFLLGWIVAAQPLPQLLSPETAMRQAAQRLPSVQAAQALLESAEAYARSIGAQPNPILRLSGTVGEPLEDANALVFRFEIAGQPGLRQLSAEQEAEARRQELVHERRVVALSTGQAYFTLWEKGEVLKLARTRTQLAHSLERTSYRRLTVGEISNNAHLRSQLEVAKALADEATAQAEFEQSTGLMNLLLGQEIDFPLDVPSNLGPLPVPTPDQSGLSPAELRTLQAQVSHLPELQALHNESLSLQSQTELAKKANSPDLQLQFYRSRITSTDVQGVQMILSIPLWDWGQVAAEVGRREGLARAAEARIGERELLMKQRILATWKHYQGALKRKQILGDQAQQFAKLSSDARRAYDANLMTLLEVFDVQQAYRQVLQSSISAEAELARAALELAALNPHGFFEEVSNVPTN